MRPVALCVLVVVHVGEDFFVVLGEIVGTLAHTVHRVLVHNDLSERK